MVTIPYVKGLVEAFTRILKGCRISTAVKPPITLRSILVHQKTKLGIRNSRRWYTKHPVEIVSVFTLEKLEDHLAQEWKSIIKKWRAL